jgi:ADP-L-glycero-D-manno-heptose 6-epimerase
MKYASSASVYGNTSDIINPLNYYAITKVIGDYWVQDHMDEFELVQGFRYFNVYGDGEDHKEDQASPVSKFTKQIKEEGKLKLFEGSDKFLRDFVCVDDVVDIVLNNDKPSGIYDLGTSNPTSFQEVAELVAKKYDGTIEYIPFPEHLEGKYQTYTCAKKEWDHEFITVKEYLQV